MKGKILLAFFISLSALAILGYVGHSTFSHLMATIKENTLPNKRLDTIKKIEAALTQAENSVRTYSITKLPNDLTAFYSSAAEINQSLSTLYGYSGLSPSEKRLTRQFEVLIEKKFTILQQIIDLKEDQRVQGIYEKVIKDIARHDSLISKNNFADTSMVQLGETESLTPSANVRKKGFFARLFGKVKKNKKKPQTSNPLSKPEAKKDSAENFNADSTSGGLASKTTITEAITKANQEEKQYKKTLLQKELSLIERDKQNMHNIRELINTIEVKEKNKSLSQSRKAEEATSKANTILLAGILVSILLFALLLWIILNDITKYRQNRLKLQNAKAKAEKLTKAREQFLSTMSHEIRTPLNAIIGFAEQLDATSLGENQKKHLHTIQQSSTHLLDIVNDILDFSKLESGKLKLERTGFKPYIEIEKIISLLQPQAQAKGLPLKLWIDGDSKVIVMGDPTRFRQILINLVMNAIKFTQQGEVKIKGNFKRGKKRAHINIDVMDSGIGIPKNKQQYIFQDFSQADNTITRNFGGTGLGLSIVKRLISIQDGAITLKSEQNVGTTFSFRLDYDLGTKNDIPIPLAKKETITKAISGRKILVVDDQEYNLALAKTILEGWGIQCYTASNGQKALKAIKNHFFDAILMDIQMPGISGIETSKQIRADADKKKSTVPIIALTADYTLKKGSDKQVFDDYLLKPFSQKTLYTKLLNLMGDDRSYSIKTNGSLEQENEEKGYNISGLIEDSQGNLGFVINMLNLFIKNTEATLPIIAKGIRNKSWKSVQLNTHKIIPPCRHLEIQYLVDALKYIETSVKEDNLAGIPATFERLQMDWLKLKPALEKEVRLLKSEENS